MCIRLATVADTEKILDIYAPYVTDTAFTFEYDIPTHEEFSSRIERTLGSYPYLVYEKDGEILGYAYAGPFHKRKAYRFAAETSIYVKKGLTHGGIGKALYSKLEELLKLQNIVVLYACIGLPNSASLGFHKKTGYTENGLFEKCGYKLGEWHDMIWMRKQLAPRAENPEEFIPFPKIKDRALSDILCF